MKVTGIIAEYNPFHNGHAYQLEQARRSTDYLIVVMSGNFVQRGEPAIYDKYTRTRAALNTGADLVLELPTILATSSAEHFAAGAVALLDKLGVVNELCFGSECGDMNALQAVAAVLAIESDDYKEQLRLHLKAGLSFPQARSQALTTWLITQGYDSALLSSPNNILGIEYMKALLRRKSQIKPITLKRAGQGYHDLELTQGFASASGIRRQLQSLESTAFPDILAKHVPDHAPALYQENIPLFADDFSLSLNETLLRLSYEGIPFHEYADVSPEIAARLQHQLLDFASFSRRIEQLKTKQYTYTRISRALLHLLLGIRNTDMADCLALDYVPYARILGFRKQSAPLLSALKHSSTIPLLTKIADANELLGESALRMLEHDLYCAHRYQTIQYQKSGVSPRNEYTKSIIII